MTHLTCNASNCASNKNNFCCRPEIKISCACCGQAPCDTRCQSFVNRASAPENSSSQCGCNPEMEIRCSADNCLHNRGGFCFAESIHINGAGAENTAQTECSSFRAR